MFTHFNRRFNLIQRNKQEEVLYSGILKDLRFVAKLKIFGRRLTSITGTKLSTLLILLISIYGRHPDTLIFTKKACLTRWKLKMKNIKLSQ